MLAFFGVLVALGLLAAAAPYLTRNPTQPMDLTVRYGLLRVGAEFAAGICLFRMSSDLPQHVRTFLSRYATGLSMAALLAILHFDWGELIAVQDGLTILMAAIIILSLRFSAGQISKVLSSRPMVFLGEVSYGIYLWHGVVLIAWLEVAGRMPEVPVLGWPYRGPIAYALVVTASIVLISIGLAAASHRWIEEPVRQLVRRKLPAK